MALRTAVRSIPLNTATTLNTIPARTLYALLCALLALLWLQLPAGAQSAPVEAAPVRNDASLPIGPAGGQVDLPAEGIAVLVPVDALPHTVTLTLKTYPVSSAEWPAGLVVLRAWGLHAEGSEPLPSAGFSAAWQATIGYGYCAELGAPAFCAEQPIDEASLHCLHQVESSGAWVRTLGMVDVLHKRLACSDVGVGEYLVVAKSLTTSGDSSAPTGVVLLPLVHGASR